MNKGKPFVNIAGDSIGEILPNRGIFLLLYNFFLKLYASVIRVYSLFNSKAKKWIDGRKDWQALMSAALKPDENRIWIHCSSIGEFEQARPLVEALKGGYPRHKIAITFFSPSGYEAIRKNNQIDYVFYLPHDSKDNARQFIDLLQPELVLFVKYEFWYHYLARLKKRKIPTLLVSGAFRNGQPFFKWYGAIFRDMLSCFSYFFLQDESSGKALTELGLSTPILISGDTRFDRVATIAQNATKILPLEQYILNHKVLIAGSTWPGDEDVLIKCMDLLPSDWKLILAPHEIDPAHIDRIKQQFGNEALLYSDLEKGDAGNGKKVLVIDNIGMLSRLYAYGTIAYIGGGFKKGGIHNILEPAVFGLPVIFGPIYEKFVEAKMLASLNLVFPVNNTSECREILRKLIEDTEYYYSISNSIMQFMQLHIGATNSIMAAIEKEGWLQA